MSDRDVARYLVKNRERLMKRSQELKYWDIWMTGAYNGMINVLVGRTNPNRTYETEVR